MTETYTLLDKGTIAKSDRFEQHYVTYTTPSPEDKNWSLTFTEASSPPHRYYYAVWRFIDDTVAREDYPIFKRLAMARNWAPIESRPIPDPPCPHTTIAKVGFSSLTRRPVYRCDKCGALTHYNRERITTGRYTISVAREIERLRAKEVEEALKKLQMP